MAHKQPKKACLAHGVSKPKIGGSESDIYVEFKNHEEDMAKEIETQKTRKKTREKTREKTGEKTGEKLLNLISAKPTITIQELSNEIGITRKGVEWQINELKQSGYIKRVGPDKGGYWKIVKKK